MPPKGKTTKAKSRKSTSEAKADASEVKLPVVSQVVEVVETEESGVSQEPNIERAVDILENVDTPQEKTEKTPAQTASELLAELDQFGEKPEKSKSEPAKRKETVDELFKADTATVAPELAAYKKGSTKSMAIWIVVVLVIALLTGIGLIGAVKGLPKIALPAISKPTPTPTLAPTPTPTQTLSRSDVKLQVLNGSGIAGAGAKMKKFLEDKGYTVSDVGNAPDFTYEATSVLVKAGKAAYLTLLQKDLQDSYTIGTAAATLSDDVSFDARVIVGKQ